LGPVTPLATNRSTVGHRHPRPAARARCRSPVPAPGTAHTGRTDNAGRAGYAAAGAGPLASRRGRTVRQTVRLGRIAGIPIGANAGVLVIVAILLAGLAAAQFPAAAPGRGGAAYLLAAAVTVVVFLASLLAHELAHA